MVRVLFFKCRIKKILFRDSNRADIIPALKVQKSDLYLKGFSPP